MERRKGRREHWRGVLRSKERGHMNVKNLKGGREGGKKELGKGTK